MSAPVLHNRTRKSASLTGRLRRQGRWLEIPLLWLLRHSDLAREGLENSGSYLFADHIYRDVPSGSGPAGVMLDRALLALPAVRSFRNRYAAARDEVVRFILDRPPSRAIDVLSAPCGLPRELAEAARIVSRDAPEHLENVRFHGLDLDEKVLEAASDFAAANHLPRFSAHHGDALALESYSSICPDFITCTGLAEFLDDEKLRRLYGIFSQILKPGGCLFTSGMRRLAFSDYLLELAELHTHYRSPAELEQVAQQAGFQSVQARLDPLKIQSLLTARH